MNDFNISEMFRKFTNMIQIGNIHAVNSQTARAKVALQGGDIITADLPWIAGRAGETSFFSAPEVSEQCLLIAPDGETANAVIILGLYSDSKPQPADNGNIHRMTFKDGALIEYNQETGNLTANVKGGVNITAAASVNITAPSDVNITGNVKVTGNISATGGIAAEGTVTSQGAIQAEGDVTAGNISLQGHIHTGDDGGSTGVARS